MTLEPRRLMARVRQANLAGTQPRPPAIAHKCRGLEGFCQGPPTRTDPIKPNSSYVPTAIKAAPIAMNVSLIVACIPRDDTGGGTRAG